MRLVAIEPSVAQAPGASTAQTPASATTHADSPPEPLPAASQGVLQPVQEANGEKEPRIENAVSDITPLPVPKELRLEATCEEDVQSKPPAEEALGKPEEDASGNQEISSEEKSLPSRPKARVSLPSTPPGSGEGRSQTKAVSTGEVMGSDLAQAAPEKKTSPKVKSDYTKSYPSPAENKHRQNSTSLVQENSGATKPTWAQMTSLLTREKGSDMFEIKSPRRSTQSETGETCSIGSAVPSPKTKTTATPDTVSDASPVKDPNQSRAQITSAARPDFIKKSGKPFPIRGSKGEKAESRSTKPSAAGAAEGECNTISTSKRTGGRRGRGRFQHTAALPSKIAQGESSVTGAPGSDQNLPSQSQAVVEDKHTWADISPRKANKSKDHGKGKAVECLRPKAIPVALPKVPLRPSGNRSAFSALAANLEEQTESGAETTTDASNTEVVIPVPDQSKNEKPQSPAQSANPGSESSTLPPSTKRVPEETAQLSRSTSTKRSKQLESGTRLGSGNVSAIQPAGASATKPPGNAATDVRPGYRAGAGGSLRIKKNRGNKVLETKPTVLEQPPDIGITPPTSDFEFQRSNPVSTKPEKVSVGVIDISDSIASEAGVTFGEARVEDVTNSLKETTETNVLKKVRNKYLDPEARELQSSTKIPGTSSSPSIASSRTLGRLTPATQDTDDEEDGNQKASVKKPSEMGDIGMKEEELKAKEGCSQKLSDKGPIELGSIQEAPVDNEAASMVNQDGVTNQASPETPKKKKKNNKKKKKKKPEQPQQYASFAEAVTGLDRQGWKSLPPQGDAQNGQETNSKESDFDIASLPKTTSSPYPFPLLDDITARMAALRAPTPFHFESNGLYSDITPFDDE